MCTLATGMGKSVVIADVVECALMREMRVLILAHRKEIVEDLYTAVLNYCNLKTEWGNVQIAIEMAEQRAPKGCLVVSASIASLKGARMKAVLDDLKPGLIITDECFPAGTLVDGKPIEQYKVGDMVRSFNHETNAVEMKQVKQLFCKPANNMVRVNLSNGESIICTAGHPFFDGVEYTPAINMTGRNVVAHRRTMQHVKDNRTNMRGLQYSVHREVMEHRQNPVLLEGVCESSGEKQAKSGEDELLHLRGGSEVRGTSCVLYESKCSAEGESLLHDRVQGCIREKKCIGSSVRDEQEVCLCPNEDEEPYDESGIRGENETVLFGKKVQTARRKRYWRHYAGERSLFCNWISERISSKNKGCVGIVRENATRLQSGFSGCSHEGGCGDRWEQPQWKNAQGTGREENTCFELIRVDSVEVLERASGHGYGELCSDNNVYNIEVEGNHNYFVNDILVHNCHHCVATQYQTIYEYCGVNRGECYHVGFTATDYRLDEKALYARDENNNPFTLEVGKSKRKVPANADACMFEKRLVNYDINYGTDNGWLCDIKMINVDTATSLEGVKRTKDGDLNEAETQDRVNNRDRTNLAIKARKDHCPGSSAMAFTAGVQHAHDAAAMWISSGDNASAIDGETDKLVREQELRKFKIKQTMVLSNHGCLTEGTNLQICDCIIMMRPSKSKSYVVQCVGRGLRPLPGVIDHLFNASAEERLLAIAASAKPYCNLIDLVDIASEGVYRIQEAIGIPSMMKMNGEKFMEVKKKVKELCEKTGRKIEECHFTYEEMEVILKRHVDISDNAKLRHREAWEPTVNGYRFTKTPPGYSAELVCNENGKQLVIKHKGEDIKRLSTAAGMEDVDLHHFLNKAAEHCNVTVAEHIKANPKFTGNSAVEKGVGYLSDKMKVQFLKMYKLQESSLDRMSKQKIEEMKQRMFATWNRGK